MIVLLVVLWAGFAVHRSPRFPGSLIGGVLAVSGAVLMVLFSLLYVAVKRIPGLKQKIGHRISTGQLLKWHVYTGAIGSILALLHTGHRFESDLGVALTGSMLITVLSGYVGRHLLGRVSTELREKRDELAKLETAYNEAVGEIARNRYVLLASGVERSMLSWISLRFPLKADAMDAPQALGYRAVRMAEAIAELEYSIKNHERFKQVAARWLKVHIAAALVFYVLLGLHIWAAIYFGLRWFD
ncbi:MAG TPA: hypothetical protein VJS12_14585 [Steroidobacteraceae bacterium]|nr:hypothetical protein [Steroidobacteraceae bacterium]